jgi:hypothetical protein
MGLSTKKLNVFIKALQVPAKGRIFLSNFVYDSRMLRLSEDILGEFWEGLLDMWDAGSKLLKPEVAIEDYSNSLKPEDFYCQGPKITKNTIQCSRIIEAQDLITYKNIDVSRTGFVINGYITKKQIRSLEVLGLTNIAKNHMTSRRAFTWVTQGKEIRKLFRKYRMNKRGELPSLLRNKLGLLHFAEDQELIEIIYPKGNVKEMLRAPTFLEGNPSLIFRSTSGDDGWGRTCDILSLEEGLPEAVHPKVEFNSDYQIRYIGKLTPPRPSFDWDKFYHSLRFKWGIKYRGEFRKL